MFPSLAINYSLGHKGHKSAMSGVFLWLCRAMSGVFLYMAMKLQWLYNLCILVFKCHLIPTKDKHNPCKAIYVCQCCVMMLIWKKAEKSYDSDYVIYIAVQCFLLWQLIILGGIRVIKVRSPEYFCG